MAKQIIAQPVKAAVGELLNEKEAAQYLHQKPRTLRLWRHTRGLPHIRVTSKVIIYRRTDIDAWLDRRRVAIAA